MCTFSAYVAFNLRKQQADRQKHTHDKAEALVSSMSPSMNRVEMLPPSRRSTLDNVPAMTASSLAPEVLQTQIARLLAILGLGLDEVFLLCWILITDELSRAATERAWVVYCLHLGGGNSTGTVGGNIKNRKQLFERVICVNDPHKKSKT